MDTVPPGADVLEHLTDADLRVLASITDGRVTVERLRRDATAAMDLLAHPDAFDAVFGPAALRSERLTMVSPFMVFAVAVHRAMAEIASRSYVDEPSGSRRVPVFDGPQLSEFLESPQRRVFLAELLASFTRIASGRYRTRTTRGWRTRRYSELDPVRLAELLEVVPENAKPGVYRRLGDVTLFLAGIFPDYVQTNALGPLDAARLLRAARLVEEDAAVGSAPAVQLFERLGARWYRQAYETVPLRTDRVMVVAEVADRFTQARRVLNHVTDQYLYPTRGSWFPGLG